MLLLDESVHVDAYSASALVTVNDKSTFYITGKGVPAWVGLEYMGQTAALIGGFQQQSAAMADHTGFLLGCRQFNTSLAWFSMGITLSIHCEQSAVVGNSLANFTAKIQQHGSANELPLATAVLSVFRQFSTDVSATELNR